MTFTFAAIVTGASAMAQSEHILFLIYFLLNMMDLVVGIINAYRTNTYDSTKLVNGVWVKVGRWLAVMLSMMASVAFCRMGQTLGLDLTMTKSLAFFVLSAFIFQEIRSTLGNLVKMGVEIPTILMKVVDKVEEVMNDADMELDAVEGHPVTLEDHIPVGDSDCVDGPTIEKDDAYYVNLEIPMDELMAKDSITLAVRIMKADKK